MSIYTSLDTHEFSPSAKVMLDCFAKASPTDEMALVALMAAAFLLAREAEQSGRHRDDLITEFGDVVRKCDLDLKARRLHLRVVGGTHA